MSEISKLEQESEGKTPDLIIDIRPEIEKELETWGITIEGPDLCILSQDTGQTKATKKPFIYYADRKYVKYLKFRKSPTGNFEIEIDYSNKKPTKYIVWKEEDRVKFKRVE